MRMIPTPDMFGRVTSAAERRVADLLAQVDLGVPATCFYSVRIPVHEYKRMSEVDFVVVWDDTVLAIEVKGGRIGRRDGLWTFTNRYGEVNTKREGPFDQASSGMNALQDRLMDRLPNLDVAFGFMVITPDQELDRDVEWEPQQHAGIRSMSVTGLTRALRGARSFWHERLRRRVHGDAYSKLLGVLRPDFDRIPGLAAQVMGLEEEYLRLADRQYDLLIGAERNDRIVCTGGAGSGKTLLAVETAVRAAADGRRVLLTCRSVRLAAVLRQRLAGTDVVCGTPDQLNGAAPAEILVVDEAQDVMDVETLLLLDGLVEGGWARGRWRIFCDPNNQANVDGVFDRQAYLELKEGAVEITLPYNCRNTSQVVRQTQLVTGADLGVARAGEGPPVDYVEYDDDDQAADLLDTRLRQLRDQGVDLDDVAVVTLRDKTDDSCAVRSKAFRRGKLRERPDAGPAVPGVAQLVTTAQIKGLEAGHVCVVDVDDTSDPAASARLYVAMTRPRIGLWIALGREAWQQLGQAPARRTTG
jgi:hypothetical protein